KWSRPRPPRRRETRLPKHAPRRHASPWNRKSASAHRDAPAPRRTAEACHHSRSQCRRNERPAPAHATEPVLGASRAVSWAYLVASTPAGEAPVSSKQWPERRISILVGEGGDCNEDLADGKSRLHRERNGTAPRRRRS